MTRLTFGAKWGFRGVSEPFSDRSNRTPVRANRSTRPSPAIPVAQQENISRRVNVRSSPMAFFLIEVDELVGPQQDLGELLPAIQGRREGTRKIPIGAPLDGAGRSRIGGKSDDRRPEERARDRFAAAL